MQQLYCPNCGKKVTADHINVQEMVAVCGNCDTVFSFETPAQKTKRRKVKKPNAITMVDNPHGLDMSFRTNFRLDADAEFINAAFGAGMLTFLMFVFLLTMAAEGFPAILPIGAGIGAVAFYYRLGLLLYNKTHITMDDYKIRVSRQPLQNIVDDTHEISLSGIESFHCEETKVSKEKQYDTPRYRVYAKLVDGTEKLIVNDLIDDYGFFIAQRLQQRLDIDDDRVDVSRLADITHDYDTGVEVLEYERRNGTESQR